MNSYPDWLINSTLSTQPTLETTTSVFSNDPIDDGQDIVKDTTTNKPTSKK